MTLGSHNSSPRANWSTQQHRRLLFGAAAGPELRRGLKRAQMAVMLGLYRAPIRSSRLWVPGNRGYEPYIQKAISLLGG